MVKRRRRRRRRRITPKFLIILILFIAALLMGILAISSLVGNKEPNGDAPADTDKPGLFDNLFGGSTPEPTPTPTPEPTPEPTPTPVPVPSPSAVAGTRASDFGLESEMQLNGSAVSSYRAPQDLTYPDAENYTKLEGVITFRGNNYRDDPTYGTAGTVNEKKLELVWTKEIPGSIAKGNPSDGTWFGVGWTGQPLIVRWPESTRRIMNLYDEKKNKDGLVEIIYATENSYIYFLDLADGSATRDRINGKWTYKGSGSLDPRGYPLLYVGAGDEGPNGPAENQIISLIDGRKLYSYGAKDKFSVRSFFAFDPATIVHAATDTVTYASETGIVYQFKLNTVYDEAAGTISINPGDVLKWRYTTKRSRDGKANNTYWLGFESSPIFWKNYMYVTDNCGDLFCFDVNTMEVVWMQDVLDDTNCTPVFELNEETGEASIYVGTSLHWTVESNNTGVIPFWRINALTGEVVWKAPGYRCTRSNVSGGIQDTAALGKNKLSDLVYVSYAMTTETETRGLLVAYNKADGTEVWKKHLGAYAWSSPLILYDDSGNGYVVQCDSAGHMYLFDGRTGETLDRLDLEGNFEASPAAFDNMIVIGTRASKIYGVKLK